MHRISVIGCSGSGKSTLADMMHRKTGMPWLELDALNHQPDWTPLDSTEFRRQVSDFMTRHRSWIIDGNYDTVADLIHAECTDLVWIDLSLPRVLSRLTVRSLHRSLARTELWNGNRERLRDLCSLDPQRSMLSWAVRTHGTHQPRFERLRHDPKMKGVRFHRLRGPRAVTRWVEAFTERNRSDQDR